ncbi:MAG: arsenic resistance N-acetyltransferase ArsN2 [Bacteroidota bacterium]
MTPRLASPADWPSIRTLLETAALPTTDLAPRDVQHFLVVTEAEEVIGCVAVEPHGDWGLLRSLAVAEFTRGRGVGGTLVDAAVDRARFDGMDHLALLTETAEPFFAARGWTRVSRDTVPEAVRQSSEFSGTCCASAVCLTRPLAETTAQGKATSPA